jgi:hypothetical protein
MKNKNSIKNISLALSLVIFLGACQKMDKPALGDYPKDAAPPGGPLKFYVAFDGSTTDPLRNAVDSVRANFANSNSLTSIVGTSGKGAAGNGSQYAKYAKPNDFAGTAQSFTISFWEKRNGMPVGEAEFPFAVSSSNGHWAGTAMMLLFDHAGAGATNDLAVMKMVIVDKNVNDTWLTWEGGNKVPGIQNNNWHHLAFVYDAATSKLTLYVDGVANANVPQWGTHGGINLDASKITGIQIGGRPKEDLGWGRSWTGGLDQFRMYNKALSAAEVQALFNSKL